MDHTDIVQLLTRNPETDLDTIRLAAAPFNACGHLDPLIERAAALGSCRG